MPKPALSTVAKIRKSNDHFAKSVRTTNNPGYADPRFRTVGRAGKKGNANRLAFSRLLKAKRQSMYHQKKTGPAKI